MVAGGACGLGASFVEALARRGDPIVFANVLDAEGKNLARQLRNEGLDVTYQYTDVTDPDSLDDAVRLCVDRHAGFDNLVNNAAIYQDLGAKAPFTDIDHVGAVAFLTSPAAEFITGQKLIVDGGGTFH